MALARLDQTPDVSAVSMAMETALGPSGTRAREMRIQEYMKGATGRPPPSILPGSGPLGVGAFIHSVSEYSVERPDSMPPNTKVALKPAAADHEIISRGGDPHSTPSD